MTSEGFEFVDRYGGAKAERPDPATMCMGQCEGTGFVPVHEDDPNDADGPWHDLWLESEAQSPSEDGYHFVKCPACRGTGKRPSKLVLVGPFRFGRSMPEKTP